MSVTAITDAHRRSALSRARTRLAKGRAAEPPAIGFRTFVSAIRSDRSPLRLAVEKGIIMKRISNGLFAASFSFAALTWANSNAAADTVGLANPSTPLQESDIKPDATGKKPTGNSSGNASIPNSSENYLGDRLGWPSAVEAKSSLNGDYTGGFCIPAKTKLIGATASMSTEVQQAKDSAGNETTSAPQFQKVTLDTDQPFWGFFGKLDNVTVVDEKHPDPTHKVNGVNTTHKVSYVPVPDNASTACPDVKNPLDYEAGAPAFVSSDDMDNVTYRSGFRYGALVVPFKMQLTGGKTLSGSSSLGGYLGYQSPLGDTGLNATPVIFAGASDISTSTTSGTTTSSQTLAGFSYGAGLLFDVKDDFHVGLVLGFDHVSSAQKYQYNDKPWISFEIGYSFAN
jgi:hypothetical protein